MAQYTFDTQIATDIQRRLRMGLDGPAGGGKTFTALSMARALVNGDMSKVVVIDTENGSAAKYASVFGPFRTIVFKDDFNPDRYTAAIKYAESAGFEVVVIDSLSHAWTGKGGALEQVDKKAAQAGGNSYAAWRFVTPMHNNLVDAMLQADCHIIATMRTKTDYVQDRDSNGKTMIKKVGLAAIQRDGMDYEFDIMIRTAEAGQEQVVTKSRCPAVADQIFKEFGDAQALGIVDWLESGEAAVARPKTRDDLLIYANSEWGVDGTVIKAAFDHFGVTFDPNNWEEMVNAIGAYMQELSTVEESEEEIPV